MSTDGWKEELAKELLKSKRKRFPRRRIHSPNIDRIWTMDLMDEQKFRRQNRNYRYILVVLDIFSRFAWARPLKTKTGKDVCTALKDIFEKSGRKPSYIWSDAGKEFFNNLMTKGLLGDTTTLYASYNQPKAAIAERFIRTLRNKIETRYLGTQQTVWYKELQNLIDEYNSSFHTGIGMSPDEAIQPENFAKVFSKQYEDRIAPTNYRLLKVGDKVRLAMLKKVFEKGTSPNWTEEVFEVVKVDTDSVPYVYSVKDMMDEVVDGTWYRYQLQKTDQQIFRIDKVLRKRKMADGTSESLVRWSGFPSKFDSWISSADVLSSKNQ